MNSEDRRLVTVIMVVVGTFLTMAVIVFGYCFTAYTGSHNSDSVADTQIEAPIDESSITVESPTQKVGVYINNNYGEVYVNP